MFSLRCHGALAVWEFKWFNFVASKAAWFTGWSKSAGADADAHATRNARSRVRVLLVSRPTSLCAEQVEAIERALVVPRALGVRREARCARVRYFTCAVLYVLAILSNGL